MNDKPKTSPLAILRDDMEKMKPQFRAALPKHIPTERFIRVALTAVQMNPELLDCSRRSLFQACMRAAHDGLMPDGREGAMVIRRDKNGNKFANWQIMVAGLRKKVRNSDEIAVWEVQTVHARDEFDYALGDEPRIIHKPYMGGDRGPIVAAYSVAVLKSGEKSREVMSIEEIHQIRDRYSDGWKAYKAKRIKSTPWADSEGEMAKKTVARRHSKVLPMSSDLEELISRDEETGPAELPAPAPRQQIAGPSSALDMFANGDGEAEEPEQEEVEVPVEPTPKPKMKEVVDTLKEDEAGEWNS